MSSSGINSDAAQTNDVDGVVVVFVDVTDFVGVVVLFDGDEGGGVSVVFASCSIQNTFP